ncbi:hypothetical protein [Janthinobacterium sp. BJB304]|uniref:hypothetical protein n=1 Tax=Janthinobacterium sp. BJB304 TaxID=1572871 RepID=UPI000C0FDACA|nr:hypothetical protein [Janthinobacterium sp. BJB304]PHV36900.1 hypothetical protein CSQ95_21855 [Janthinobacterium sp. BJB304]
MMKILAKDFHGAAVTPNTSCGSTKRAGQRERNDYVHYRVAKRVEDLIVAAGQITGKDLAAEMKMSMDQLRKYTRYLQAGGRAHKMRGLQYPTGVWIPGPETAHEHERGQVPVHLRVKHWQRSACRIELAEALLFNRFPALTAALLDDKKRMATTIRFPKAE